MIVIQTLNQLGLEYNEIGIGFVELKWILSTDERVQLNALLLECGLELLDGKKSIIVESIKNVIIEMIQHTEHLPLVNYSHHISSKLQYDYTYLSNMFTEVTGKTIQQFIICHKIEKVKELLLYDELNLTEISHKLHYCNVAHLSGQFKKATGLTPSIYKKLKIQKRNMLEDI
jgi:YesN/AraC family two-component response regulator